MGIPCLRCPYTTPEETSRPQCLRSPGAGLPLEIPGAHPLRPVRFLQPEIAGGPPPGSVTSCPTERHGTVRGGPPRHLPKEAQRARDYRPHAQIARKTLSRTQFPLPRNVCPAASGGGSSGRAPPRCPRAGKGLPVRSVPSGRPDAATGGPARPADRRAIAGNPAGARDDVLLAALYVRMWALASGRPLPRNVPPSELSEEELISFWADDFGQPGGRHAACPASAGSRR